MCSNNGFKHERDFFFKYHKINFVWALLFQFCQYTLHTHPQPVSSSLSPSLVVDDDVIVKGLFIWNKCKIYLYLFAIARFRLIPCHITQCFYPFFASLYLYIFCDLQSNWFSRSFSSSSLLPYFIHCAWLRSVKNGRRISIFFCFYTHREKSFSLNAFKIPFYSIS